jgi:Circularly permutated YpsA SLOG family
MNLKIISGGQTGVDQAALRAARAAGQEVQQIRNYFGFADSLGLNDSRSQPGGATSKPSCEGFDFASPQRFEELA